MRDALVASYDDSLKNDQDINTCLNQANTGTIAIIFQGCLSATASDSNASTAAKQHFFTLYKQLRSQVGQPPSTLGGAVGGLACAADALANALTHSEANG